MAKLVVLQQKPKLLLLSEYRSQLPLKLMMMAFQCE
jgi:hypothetical protein